MRANGYINASLAFRQPVSAHTAAVPAPLPTLNALWRPNNTGPSPQARDDRELIRYYAGWPTSQYNLQQLTSVLNRVADTSAATVARVQAWINEIEDLEETWADQVADGTAHLGNVSSYEGPLPGTTLTRDDLRKKADVLEWDTTLLRVKYDTGGRSDATAGATIANRMAQLKQRIFQTLGIKPNDGGPGDAYVVRS